MEYIKKSDLIKIIDAELSNAKEGASRTNAACFKIRAMHLQNFKEIVQEAKGIDLADIIKVLHEYRYHHAADIVEATIKDE